MNIGFVVAGGATVLATSCGAAFLSVYISKKKKRPEEEENAKRRDTLVQSDAYLFYRCMAGYMLGTAICTHYTSLDWLFAVCFLGTYVLIYVCNLISKIWNSNENLVIPRDIMPEGEFCVDNEDLETNNLVWTTPSTLASDVTVMNFGSKETKRRFWFFILQLVATTFLTVAVPLKTDQNVGTLFCFIFSVACSTLSVCGGMVHVHMHFVNQRKWWIVTTLYWMAVVCAGQCVPLFVLTQPWMLPAGGAFLGVPAAAMLFLHNYYTDVDMMDHLSKKKLFWGVVCFAGSIAQAPLTRYFLFAIY